MVLFLQVLSACVCSWSQHRLSCPLGVSVQYFNVGAFDARGLAIEGSNPLASGPLDSLVQFPSPCDVLSSAWHDKSSGHFLLQQIHRHPLP